MAALEDIAIASSNDETIQTPRSSGLLRGSLSSGAQARRDGSQSQPAAAGQAKRFRRTLAV
jgi:hypothetical protein